MVADIEDAQRARNDELIEIVERWDRDGRMRLYHEGALIYDSRVAPALRPYGWRPGTMTRTVPRIHPLLRA